MAIHDVKRGQSVGYNQAWVAPRDTRVGVVPIGYADGYRRALSNRGTVLLNGHRVSVAGIVTMDMTMIDVTDVPCEIGDVATLIGRDGEKAMDFGLGHGKSEDAGQSLQRAADHAGEES